jgi:hypothetical protein
MNWNFSSNWVYFLYQLNMPHFVEIFLYWKFRWFGLINFLVKIFHELFLRNVDACSNEVNILYHFSVSDFMGVFFHRKLVQSWNEKWKSMLIIFSVRLDIYMCFEEFSTWISIFHGGKIIRKIDLHHCSLYRLIFDCFVKNFRYECAYFFKLN